MTLIDLQGRTIGSALFIKMWSRPAKTFVSLYKDIA
jgi:hypothetical protein